MLRALSHSCLNKTQFKGSNVSVVNVVASDCMWCGLGSALIRYFSKNLQQSHHVSCSNCAGSKISGSAAGGYKALIEVLRSVLPHTLFPFYYENWPRLVLCPDQKTVKHIDGVCLSLPFIFCTTGTRKMEQYWFLEHDAGCGDVGVCGTSPVIASLKLGRTSAMSCAFRLRCGDT
jgi:hypothetical protein